jgi:hypothetical protein
VYKLDRRNTVRDRIVDLEVRKLELRQERARRPESSDRRTSCQADDRR